MYLYLSEYLIPFPFIGEGGPVNLYNDQHLCLNFGMNFEGNKEQCTNPEGFARFLGLLESVPFNDTFSNEHATADSRCISLLNFSSFCCIMQSVGANKLFLVTWMVL